MTKTILVPVEPSEEMWGGLARDIVMWMRMSAGERGTGKSLHQHLRNIRGAVPEWLAIEIPDIDHVPPKGTIAACIYKAMLEAAPKPIPADEREEVARALYYTGHRRKFTWEEAFEIDRIHARRNADAAISTLQGLGWAKK